MSNVVDMPDGVTMRAFTQVGDDQWSLTEWVLNDPSQYRRLVRTQIEELLALSQHYPLPEFDSVRQILTQLQRAYSDVEPFYHPPLTALDDEDVE
jgi:hypothetical protein